MNSKPPIGIIVCGVLIFIASFLDWGTFQLTGSPPGNAPPQLAALMKQMSVTINGWEGHLTLSGLRIPNWVVIVSGVSVMILTLLRFGDIWEVPRGLLIALSMFGVVHVGIFSFIMITKATIGIGALLAFGCFIGLAVQTVMLSERSHPVAISRQSLEYSPIYDSSPVPPTDLINPMNSMPPSPGPADRNDDPLVTQGDPFYEWRQRQDGNGS